MNLYLHRAMLMFEKGTVDGLLERLKEYTANVTAEDGNLLRRQRMAMKEYSYVLGLRIEQLPPISVDD